MSAAGRSSVAGSFVGSSVARIGGWVVAWTFGVCGASAAGAPPAGAEDDGSPPFSEAERKTVARYEKLVRRDGDAARLSKSAWIVEAPAAASDRFVAELAVWVERVDAFVVRRLDVKKRWKTQPTLVVFPNQAEFLERVEVVGRTAFFRAWVDKVPLGVAVGGGGGARRGKGQSVVGGEYHVYTGLVEEGAPSFATIDRPAIRREVVRAVLYAAATGNLVEAFWFDRGASQVLGRLDPFGPDDAPGTAPRLEDDARPPLAPTLSLLPAAWVADDETMLRHDPIAESVFVFLESDEGARFGKKVRKGLSKLRSGRGELLGERDVARLEEAWHAWLDAADADSE